MTNENSRPENLASPSDVPLQDVIQMSVDITLGRDFSFPDTSAHHQVWDQLVIEIAEIKADGYIVDIPSEIPDLGDYDGGTS